MILRLVISLYTTRVILQALGTDDYGIYILVAGFTVMFSFVNSSMSTAVSRFISYSIGENNSTEYLKRIFGSALLIQSVIVLLIVMVGSVIGLFFISQVLSIPSTKIDSAVVLFICTLSGLALSLLQVPYNAVIVSYEKMTAYAYIEIVNSILLLAIALVLKCGSSNPLMLYGGMMLCVYIAIFFTYIIYCRRFAICRFKLVYDKKIIKPMLCFLGADLFSNSAMSIQTQGQSVIFNKFYTLTSNAAIGIANQLYGAMLMFASSITTAIRPQIIKNYAAGETDKALNIIFIGSKILSFAIISISTPIILKIDFILQYWLVTYPSQASIFVAIILISNASFGYKGITVIIIQATGKMLLYSILNGLIFLTVIPIQYGLAKLGYSDIINYCIVLVVSVLNVALNFLIISKYLSKSFRDLMTRCGFPPIIGMALCLLGSYHMSKLFPNTIMCSICFMLISLILSSIICWIIVLDKQSRFQIIKIVNTGLSKFKIIR